MRFIRAVLFAAAISAACSTTAFAANQGPTMGLHIATQNAAEDMEAAETTESAEGVSHVIETAENRKAKGPGTQTETSAVPEEEPQEEEPQEEEQQEEPQKEYTAYSCTDEEIRWIAAVAVNENGYDENAVRYEVSLICNLTDAGQHGSTPYEVTNSKWFAVATKRKAKKTAISDEILAIVRDVLGGNRISDCNEHDNVHDIASITTDGVTMVSQAEIQDVSNYVSGETIIRNKYGSTYLFECFPAQGTDPFGKLI